MNNRKIYIEGNREWLIWTLYIGASVVASVVSIVLNQM